MQHRQVGDLLEIVLLIEDQDLGNAVVFRAIVLTARNETVFPDLVLNLILAGFFTVATNLTIFRAMKR